MRNLILFIIGSIFFGCANLDIAQQAYQKGDYNTSFNIYNKWAKAGFGKANLKLAQLANDNNIQKNTDFIINNALKAYKNGYKKAANILFVNYYKIQDIPNASLWFEKIDFDSINQKQLNAYFSFLNYYIPKTTKQAKLQKLEQYAINDKNEKILYALGKFYEPINLQKSEKYYKLAYKQNYTPAGIKLGLLYIYKLNQPKKGLNILKKLADKDNGKTAYEIAVYFLNKMDEELWKINNPCISFNFNTPKQFFIKKIKAQKYQKLFLNTNIIPWLNYSYKKGYILAKLKLISLDLKFNNFGTNHTLCKMNLPQTIKFLQLTKLLKAKLILAKIYTTYPSLHQYNQAKFIYKNYIRYNKTAAYWDLYQYYKKFKPNSKEQKFYLNQLVLDNFTPAIIEKAYLDENINTLKYYAQQNNILALTYLSSIYAHKNLKKQQISILHKLCRLTSPINPSLDMKIAKTYTDINKSATIYQYYAYNNISSSQYYLANIYKNLNECNKTIYWLKQAQNNGYTKAQLEYDKLLLNGYIKGDVNKTISHLKLYKNNPQILLLLGNIYAKGILVDFNPQKAMYYYDKAIALGNERGYLEKINLLNILNVGGNLDLKIEQTYQKLIKKSKNPQYKLMFANYYFNHNKLKKAKQIIQQYNLTQYPYGRYLFSTITGKNIFIHSINTTKNSYLLLLYAKKIAPKNKSKALYYAFLSSLYGNKDAPNYIVSLLPYFYSKTYIELIYQKAKQTYINNQKQQTAPKLP